MQAIGAVPSVEWDEFWELLWNGDLMWRQGEHIAMIGPTGCGKSTLAMEMLKMRRYTTLLCTKPYSSTLSKYIKANKYQTFTEWPDKVPASRAPRRAIWPDVRTVGKIPRQRYAIGHAMEQIYTEGNWCVYADELRYIADNLNLKPIVELFLQQGRELGVSFVGGMQRPKFVPLVVYSQSTHLFFWRERDRRNLDTISAINSIDSFFTAQQITQLEPHEFLYINTRVDPEYGGMLRSRLPLKEVK